MTMKLPRLAQALLELFVLLTLWIIGLFVFVALPLAIIIATIRWSLSWF